MAENIFQIDDSGRIRRMQAEGYANELNLQELISHCCLTTRLSASLQRLSVGQIPVEVQRKAAKPVRN